MAYPNLYGVTYSYTGFQQSQQGISAFPGTQLDADLAGLTSSIDGLAAFVQNAMRSDGALNNGSVTFDSLSPTLQTAGLAPAQPWATATAYKVDNSVVNGVGVYRALKSHTSGVFATDLAAGDWLLIATLPTRSTELDFELDYGGVPGDIDNTYTAVNDAAWTAFFAALQTTGRRGKIQPKVYRFSNAAASVTSLVFNLDASGATLKRMNNIASPMLEVIGAFGPLIAGATFLYAGVGTLADGNHQSARFVGCTNPTFRKVSSVGAWYCGVELRNSIGGTIDDCYSQGCVNRGLFINSTSTGNIGRPSIINSTVDGQGVTFYAINTDIAAGHVSADVAVIGCRIFNALSQGIGISGVTQATIEGNLVNSVVAPGGIGILVQIVNQTVSVTGVRPQRTSIKGNVVVGVQIGIAGSDDILSDCSGNIISASIPVGASATIAIGIEGLGSQSGKFCGNTISVTANTPHSAIGMSFATGLSPGNGAPGINTADCRVQDNDIFLAGTSATLDGIATDAASSAFLVLFNKIEGATAPYSIGGTGHLILTLPAYGNTAVLATSSGALPVGHTAVFDANGNITDGGVLGAAAAGSLTGTTLAANVVSSSLTSLGTITTLVATKINGNTFTAGTGILTFAALKTLTISNTLTLTATDGSTLAIGAGGTLGSNAYTSTAYAPLVSPGFTTPSLGVATATSINKVAITAPATGSTLTIADGKTATHNATTTFAGTDGKTLTISNSGTLSGGDAFTLSIAAAKTLTVSNTLTLTATDGSTLAIGAGGTLGSNAYTSTAYAPLVSPGFTTPSLGVATATSINKVAITAPATGSTLTIADGKTATHNATTTFAGTDGKTLTISNSLTLAGTDATVMTFPATSTTVAGLGIAETFTAVQTISAAGIPLIINSTNSAQNIQMQAAGATTAFFGGAAGAPLFVQNPSGTNVVSFNFSGVVAASAAFTAQGTGLPVIYGAAGSDTNIDIQLAPKGTGVLQVGNASSMTANGAVATALSSIGPTGSHTTVQEWLTIKNSTGTVRYVPTF